MSKMLEATCTADGMVMIGEVEVPAAVVLSEGNQASEGMAIGEGDKWFYTTSSATDIKTTIEKAVALIESIAPALTEIATALTAIGTNMTGPTTSPPASLPASVITINAKVTELNLTKSELNTLKGALK